jgi:hypothetical protein
MTGRYFSGLILKALRHAPVTHVIRAQNRRRCRYVSRRILPWREKEIVALSAGVLASYSPYNYCWYGLIVVGESAGFRAGPTWRQIRYRRAGGIRVLYRDGRAHCQTPQRLERDGPSLLRARKPLWHWFSHHIRSLGPIV